MLRLTALNLIGMFSLAVTLCVASVTRSKC
jgi:hypothetical protein